jgi:hypothetical protein
MGLWNNCLGNGTGEQPKLLPKRPDLNRSATCNCQLPTNGLGFAAACPDQCAQTAASSPAMTETCAGRTGTPVDHTRPASADRVIAEPNAAQRLAEASPTRLSVKMVQTFEVSTIRPPNVLPPSSERPLKPSQL